MKYIRCRWVILALFLLVQLLGQFLDRLVIEGHLLQRDVILAVGIAGFIKAEGALHNVA